MEGLKKLSQHNLHDTFHRLRCGAHVDQGVCEYHGHLHIRFYLGRSHVGSNDSNYKIIKVSMDVHKGEHP